MTCLSCVLRISDLLARGYLGLVLVGRAMLSEFLIQLSADGWGCAPSLLVFWPQMTQSWSLSSVAQSCPTLCNPMDWSTPGFPVHHQLPELAHTHVHQVGEAIQPSHPLLSPSPTFNRPQHQGLFQWFSFSHQVAKVLEFQLQHQSFQWM